MMLLLLAFVTGTVWAYGFGFLHVTTGAIHILLAQSLIAIVLDGAYDDKLRLHGTRVRVLPVLWQVDVLGESRQLLGGGSRRKAHLADDADGAAADRLT